MQKSKNKRILLYSTWVTALVSVVVLICAKAQFITVFLCVLSELVLNALFFLKDKESVSQDVRKALKITFEFGAYFFIIRSVSMFIDLIGR